MGEHIINVYRFVSLKTLAHGGGLNAAHRQLSQFLTDWFFCVYEGVFPCVKMEDSLRPDGENERSYY